MGQISGHCQTKCVQLTWISHWTMTKQLFLFNQNGQCHVEDCRTKQQRTCVKPLSLITTALDPVSLFSPVVTVQEGRGTYRAWHGPPQVDGLPKLIQHHLFLGSHLWRIYPGLNAVNVLRRARLWNDVLQQQQLRCQQCTPSKDAALVVCVLVFSLFLLFSRMRPE